MVFTTDPSSLRALCAQTELILNCVGPFRLYGEPLVAACAETGCDYLDICGEPEFMERMEANYHDRAVETGSLLISACGFDSDPAELGLMFNSRQWVAPSLPNRVEAYLSLGAFILRQRSPRRPPPSPPPCDFSPSFPPPRDFSPNFPPPFPPRFQSQNHSLRSAPPSSSSSAIEMCRSW